MKRTVKAWAVVSRDRGILLCAEPFRSSALDVARAWNSPRMVTRACTITYDDGKPAKRRKRGGK